MKKIKIQILRYDPKDTCSYGFYILSILKKHYEVELSDTPDYLFYNESQLEHINYSCIKIFYTGENMYPDFNLCDYALAFNYIQFGDRYTRLPIYLVSTFYREKELAMIKTLNPKASNDASNDSIPQITKEDLSQKDGFCSFVYSNYLASTERKDFYDALSMYKKVNSGGAYLNNVGGRVDNKLAFEMRHKFSIAFENSSNDGYTTEKLPNALSAQTIPIYWGNPLIGKEFNTKRFINCHDFKDFDAVVERIKEIDSNDDLYLQIINEPVYAEGYDTKKVEKDFESFLIHIFDQQMNEASRVKINPARQSDLLKNLQLLKRIVDFKNNIHYSLSLLYKPFKKFAIIESAKKNFLAKKIVKLKN